MKSIFNTPKAELIEMTNKLIDDAMSSGSPIDQFCLTVTQAQLSKPEIGVFEVVGYYNFVKKLIAK